MVATLERPKAKVVLGSTEPRIWTRPLRKLTPKTSYGFAVIEFARDVLGLPLDPWQEWLVIHIGELLADGRPRFRRVLTLVARQNGKTTVILVLTLFWLFEQQHQGILWTSAKLAMAKRWWKKAVVAAQRSGELSQSIASIRYGIGEECLTTTFGGEFMFAAATESGGRSLTVDRLVIDELRLHKDWDAYSALSNTTNAVSDAQIFMISNAGDVHSVPLNELREQAMEGLDLGLGLFEWSSSSEMDVTDPKAIAMANPNLGRRIDLENLLGEARRAQSAGGDQLATFITEVHCRYVPLLDPAIDLEAWAECRAEGDLGALRDRVALCLDVSMDELHATLYAAAVEDARVRIDAVASWDGQTAVAEMRSALPDLVAQVKPKVLGWFPNGPAATAAASLEERPGWPPRGVKLDPIRGDVAAVCMGFAEQVRSRAIVRTDDPLLDAHVRAAEKIAWGDGWRFARKGVGHVDAVYAAAGAVHLARLMPAPFKPRASSLSW